MSTNSLSPPDESQSSSSSSTSLQSPDLLCTDSNGLCLRTKGTFFDSESSGIYTSLARKAALLAVHAEETANVFTTASSISLSSSLNMSGGSSSSAGADGSKRNAKLKGITERNDSEGSDPKQQQHQAQGRPLVVIETEEYNILVKDVDSVTWALKLPPK
jgi:hypothetical protein